MQTSAIIEGLIILEKYRVDKDRSNCGAEHDALYVYATDRPVEHDDLGRLIELGWFQYGVHYAGDRETGGEFAVKHYDPGESWVCYT